MGETLNVSCVEGAAAEADGTAHHRSQRQDSQQEGPPVSLQTTETSLPVYCFEGCLRSFITIFSINVYRTGKPHLHPISEVFKVVQMENGVFQPGDGPVGVQQTTHVELIAVALVLGARGAADQRQQFFLEVVGKHRRRGAGARVWFICQTQKKKKTILVRIQLLLAELIKNTS